MSVGVGDRVRILKDVTNLDRSSLADRIKAIGATGRVVEADKVRTLSGWNVDGLNRVLMVTIKFDDEQLNRKFYGHLFPSDEDCMEVLEKAPPIDVTPLTRDARYMYQTNGSWTYTH